MKSPPTNNKEMIKNIKLKALEEARRINPNSSWLDVAEMFIEEFPSRSDRQELRKEVFKEVQAGKEKYDFFHQIDVICSKFPCIGVKGD